MFDQRYRALLVTNSTFPEDSSLTELEGPRNDGIHLRDALCHAETGLFDPRHVRLVPERAMPDVLREVDDFLSSAARDDRLLLFYSGHGLRQVSGDLYFATRDTRLDRLPSSAVKAATVSEMIDASDARVKLVFLDCCHSGRFKGPVTAQELAGEGRFVLMSSRPGELAQDTDNRNGASLFTHVVAEGLRSGATDDDADGSVDFDDLYRYVHRMLRPQRQTPTRDLRGSGDVPLARRPISTPAPPPTPLPAPTPPRAAPRPAPFLVDAAVSVVAWTLTPLGRVVTAIVVLVLLLVAVALWPDDDDPGTDTGAGDGASGAMETVAVTDITDWVVPELTRLVIG